MSLLEFARCSLFNLTFTAFPQFKGQSSAEFRFSRLRCFYIIHSRLFPKSFGAGAWTSLTVQSRPSEVGGPHKCPSVSELPCRPETLPAAKINWLMTRTRRIIQFYFSVVHFMAADDDGGRNTAVVRTKWPQREVNTFHCFFSSDQSLHWPTDPSTDSTKHHEVNNDPDGWLDIVLINNYIPITIKKHF